MWVRWLWLTKIKSRFCFLTILEFMDVARPDFKTILIMCQPLGAAFYEAFIKKSAQYNSHDFDAFIRVGMQEMLDKHLKAQNEYGKSTFVENYFEEVGDGEWILRTMDFGPDPEDYTDYPKRHNRDWY
jgi:hypothetical protein